VILDIVVTLSVHRIKEELIRENIDEFVSQRKFIIKGGKRQNNFIESVVYAYNRTFDDHILFQNGFIQE